MADPLALFAGDDSDSDSDSSDNGDEQAARNAQKTEAKKPASKPANALPDPLSLLAATGRPSFLDRPHERGIDWERRTVKAPEPPPDEEYVPYSYRAKGSSALPAVSSHTTPESYEPAPPAEDPTSEGDRIQKEMKAWNSLYQYEPDSLVNVSEEDKAVAKLIAEEAVLENMELNAAQKRAAEEDREAERGASNKKLKSESFRHKEKRKRDLGMANREKSYVEEEKRILRQSFGDT
ncbi:C1orf52 [Branchiostoma lanceolatum]|uniref:C1orf52 protein n=1 Tax=Branchiostoma lanceolatum TaxID=7740 RepID=A0A8K0AF14_BRALA|nr:C1orf52 [Branchiostoma lanceolatum]